MTRRRWYPILVLAGIVVCVAIIQWAVFAAWQPGPTRPTPVATTPATARLIPPETVTRPTLPTSTTSTTLAVL